MVEMTLGRRLSIIRLIFIPSVITLAVTLFLVIGELKHWSPVLFNPATVKKSTAAICGGKQLTSSRW